MTLKDKLCSTPAGKERYQSDRTHLAVTELICRLMQRHKITRRELADRLSCTPANITQILGSRTTMQLGTLSKILTALGYQLDPRARPIVPVPVQMTTFPDRLRKARADAHLSIRQLAAAAELSPSVIGSYETGRTDPGRAIVERLAKALGVDVAWLGFGISPSEMSNY
jgi:transcriptional regulator with XRE-family HTH domain